MWRYGSEVFYRVGMDDPVWRITGPWIEKSIHLTDVMVSALSFPYLMVGFAKFGHKINCFLF